MSCLNKLVNCVVGLIFSLKRGWGFLVDNFNDVMSLKMERAQTKQEEEEFKMRIQDFLGEVALAERARKKLDFCLERMVTRDSDMF